MANNKVSWKIGGEAGYGIMESGVIFAKAFSRQGYHVFCYPEYPSLIRGGHNTFHIRIEDEQIYSQVKPVDLLVALNQDTIAENANEVVHNGGIIYDPEMVTVHPFNGITLFAVPIKHIVRENNGVPIMRNIVAIGASIAVLGYNPDLFAKILKEEFGKKGKAIVDQNITLFMAGYHYIKDHYGNIIFKNQMEQLDPVKRMLMNGNQAIATGAIKAGCKFIAAYPMTPATGIMVEMAANEHKHNILVKQPEDEITAINMTIGASFAGVRAMTATSGGGFALMSEALGMAGITETPLVAVIATRGGPSTGIPTWTEQSDLKFALNASHGEFPRIIVAPGDVTESFQETIRSFNLAYKYQLPVIIMTDKYLAGSVTTTEFFDQHEIPIPERDVMTQEEVKRVEDYKRFQFTDTGISPRAIPGQENAVYMVTSDEHTEHGIFDESIENRNMMMYKRFNKLELAQKELPIPKLHGPENADITLVSWGSTKGPILEAMKFLNGQGISVNFLQIVYIYPFPEDYFNAIIDKTPHAIVLENNFTGQLAGIIREFTGKKLETFLKFDGRPFHPEEVVDKVKQVLGK